METINVDIEEYNNLLTKSKLLDVIYYSALENSYLSYDNKHLTFDSCSGTFIENLRHACNDYFKDYNATINIKINAKLSEEE